MIRSLLENNRIFSTSLLLFLFLFILSHESVKCQGNRYWDQNLNSEAALLSGAVVAGESGIAAIYYNPATISEMKKTNLSLSANLFSTYFFNAKNALGNDLPAERLQLDIYPRIITLTLKPKKNPDLSIEIAYFTKSNEYQQINVGTSLTEDIIASNPGNENYSGEYYLRSKYQDYNGGAGVAYKVSERLSLGVSGLISYKDDQFYNLITANAFTLAGSDPYDNNQYVSDSRYHIKYNMFDVRLVTKLGLHYKQNAWAFGVNINLPSLKIFGDGTVVRQYEYSNIHKEPDNPQVSGRFYGGRQSGCTAHFKDPLSVAAGANFYSPSGKSILLFTAEYFVGISNYDYIEAHRDIGENGYNYTPVAPEEWLTFTRSHEPVFNAGIAFKQYLKSDMMISGGFRTDFRYSDSAERPGIPIYNEKAAYPMSVYHFNSGMGYNFKKGSIILGMQFTYGQDKNQKQIVNLTSPVEYISELIMPLTGQLNNNVLIRYYDITMYLGFLFNFMKE
jgi:hypothetical protein